MVILDFVVLVLQGDHWSSQDCPFHFGEITMFGNLQRLLIKGYPIYLILFPAIVVDTVDK